MAIWIGSLSWTLICSLGQGFVVYVLLSLVLKLIPELSAKAKHRSALSAMVMLLIWFVATWWQQYHMLIPVSRQLLSAGEGSTVTTYMLLPTAGTYTTLLSFVQAIFPWLSLFYMVGLSLMLVRLSAGMRQLFQFGSNGVFQPAAAQEALLTLVKKRLHYTGRAQLFISVKAQVPMVVGFLKPMILMPASVVAQMSMEQLETILMHELAHIKRYDHLVNILQVVIETILFFNPFVWMISAITRREMEHSCDDLVIAHTQEPLSYATALATLAGNSNQVPVFTLAASGRDGQLFNRIKRIMEMKRNTFSYSRVIAAIFIVAAIISSVAWLVPPLPGSKDKNNKTTASKEELPSINREPSDSPSTQTDESKLISLLITDGLVDQVKGFTVEKIHDKLFINTKEQSAEVTGKYQQGIHKENMRVEVYPFTERLKQHPDGSFIQILLPVGLSSPCVDYGPKKPGC